MFKRQVSVSDSRGPLVTDPLNTHPTEPSPARELTFKESLQARNIYTSEDGGVDGRPGAQADFTAPVPAPDAATSMASVILSGANPAGLGLVYCPAEPAKKKHGALFTGKASPSVTLLRTILLQAQVISAG